MAPRTPEELDAYGVMHPDMKAELEAHPVRAPQPSDPYYGQNDIQGFRAHRAATLREMHHLRYLPGPIPDRVEEEDRLVRMRDGADITVRVYRPVAAAAAAAAGEKEEEEEEGHQGESKSARRGGGGGRPLIVMYHEGAWCMGDLSDEEVNCRLFARDFGAVCVNVGYRLAPEHPWPTWINDSWDALQWAAASAASLGADPAGSGFLVGGGSAGGNIAAVLAHVARDEGLSPPLTGHYMAVPTVTCHQAPSEIPERYRAEYRSHVHVTPNRDPVLIMPGDGPSSFGQLLGCDFASPLFVPFLYGEEEEEEEEKQEGNNEGEGKRGHRGLPPAYLQVCGLDPFRDEALIYERVLREEAGVPTRLDVYPGFGHYFWTNYPRLSQSKAFVEDTLRGVAWLLEQSWKD